MFFFFFFFLQLVSNLFRLSPLQLTLRKVPVPGMRAVKDRQVLKDIEPKKVPHGKRWLAKVPRVERKHERTRKQPEFFALSNGEARERAKVVT